MTFWWHTTTSYVMRGLSSAHGSAGLPASHSFAPEVVDWEPHAALVPGPDGTEDLDVLVDGAPAWLAPGGAFVLELDPRQVESLAARAAAAGLVDVGARPDLAGRDRALVARMPG